MCNCVGRKRILIADLILLAIAHSKSVGSDSQQRRMACFASQNTRNQST